MSLYLHSECHEQDGWTFLIKNTSGMSYMAANKVLGFRSLYFIFSFQKKKLQVHLRLGIASSLLLKYIPQE